MIPYLPPVQDLAIYSGVPTTYGVDSPMSVTLNGSAVDLTDHVLRLVAKRAKTDDFDDAVIVLTSEDPTQIEITDAVNGFYNVQLAASWTAAMAGDTILYYDLTLTDEDGVTVPLFQGRIFITANAFRDDA
jgi:hypothetical protein